MIFIELINIRINIEIFCSRGNAMPLNPYFDNFFFSRFIEIAYQTLTMHIVVTGKHIKKHK